MSQRALGVLGLSLLATVGAIYGVHYSQREERHGPRLAERAHAAARAGCGQPIRERFAETRPGQDGCAGADSLVEVGGTKQSCTVFVEENPVTF